IELNDVIADPVREVWIDEGRFLGDARITGGFLLQPIRWATVGPADARFRSGEARTASDVLVRDLRGTIDCTIHGFDPRLVGGSDVFDFVTTDVALDGVVPDLTSLHNFADASATGGGGAAHVEVVVERGALTRADIDVTSEAAHVALGEHAV